MIRIEEFDPNKNPVIAEIFNKNNMKVNYVILCENIPVAYSSTTNISNVSNTLFSLINNLLRIKNIAKKYGYEIFFKAGHNFVRISKSNENRVYIPTYYAVFLKKNNKIIARLVFENRLSNQTVITEFTKICYTVNNRDYELIMWNLYPESFEDFLKWLNSI